jgi:predicted transglutaminase-like cysteine proteinase
MLKRRWLAALLFGSALGCAGAAEARNYPPLFGAKEIGSANWKFNKGIVVDWKGMLTRWKSGAACETKICTAKSWSGLVAQVKGAGDSMAQIKAANTLMNNPALHPYIEDITNWSKNEYWATGYEFMKKSGDCEDFSIAKYMLLKAAGIPVENMRIFQVRVRSLGGIGHAILVVYQGNKAWVLDNRTPSVMDASLIRLEFQPVMSLNENQWWYHLPGK